MNGARKLLAKIKKFFSRFDKFFAQVRNVLLFIAARYTSYVFSCISIAYGFILLSFPSLYYENQSYNILNQAMGDWGLYTLSFAFISIGSISLIATTKDMFKTRLFTLYILLTLWLFIGLTFLTQWLEYGVPNAGWLLVFGIFAFGCNVLISGWVDKCKIRGI